MSEIEKTEGEIMRLRRVDRHRACFKTNWLPNPVLVIHSNRF